MLYKGINILVKKEDAKYMKKLKKVIDNFVEGKKRSEYAIIDSVLKVETNNLKLYKTTFATICEMDQYRYFTYISNGYAITNLKDEIIYVHPNKPLIPQTNINTCDFISYEAPNKQVLTNEQIVELGHLKKYLNELDKLGQEK